MISFLLTIENEKARSKLEEIYETYHKDMYITAFSILKNHHESEDIVQDAILRVSKNLHKEYILITAKELNGTKYMIFSNTTGGETVLYGENISPAPNRFRKG